MDESVLTSIKKLLGITEEDTSFDVDILIHIGSVFFILEQLGANVAHIIEWDKSITWSSVIPNIELIEIVKSFVYLRVKLLFDPPASSSLVESINRMSNEFEWRISVAVDPPKLAPVVENPEIGIDVGGT